MALDRQSIERRDFPIARRGYEPGAVDAHLATIAEQVEGLQRSSRRPADTLAGAASTRVQAIVEAAERSAAEIERQASDEATEVRRSSAEHAERTRSEAASQAREHVEGVAQATAAMLQRIDTMKTELGTLLDSLRTGAKRLNADLAQLQGEMAELGETGRSAGRARTAAPAAPAAPVVADDFDRPEPTPAVAAAAAPAAAAPADESADLEGARLIALNMALNGSPRAEAESYLAENFDLDDAGGLLDEVYARVQ